MTLGLACMVIIIRGGIEPEASRDSPHGAQCTGPERAPQVTAEAAAGSAVACLTGLGEGDTIACEAGDRSWLWPLWVSSTALALELWAAFRKQPESQHLQEHRALGGNTSSQSQVPSLLGAWSRLCA